jgi:hypothetical protein
MDFLINPNTHFLKTLFIIESCNTMGHIYVAEKCIDVYDSHHPLYISTYKKKTIKPIISNNGVYDHETAIWLLKKKLKLKRTTLK